MNKSNKITLILITAVLLVSGIISGIILLTSRGEYDYSESYYYKPANPSSIESLNVESDIGDINIRYNNTYTDYYAKIDLYIHVKGTLVFTKSFSDLFEPIQWINSSYSTISFNLDTKDTPWAGLGLSRDVKVYLTLRTDVIYELDISATTGDILMDIPPNIIIDKTTITTSTGSVFLNSAINTTFQGDLILSSSTGNIESYAYRTNFTQGIESRTSTGKIELNLENCMIGDDLIGKVSTGNIYIKSYSNHYTQDCNWQFETSTGNIDIEIHQYVELDANVDGSIKTSTGNIDVKYMDNQASIGAQFTGSTNMGSISYFEIVPGSFSQEEDVFSSVNFNIAEYKYIISLTTSTGNIEVQGESAHI